MKSALATKTTEVVVSLSAIPNKFSHLNKFFSKDTPSAAATIGAMVRGPLRCHTTRAW